MSKKVDENTLFTSANIITTIRIFFVPVFVVALLSPWPSWIDGSGKLDFIKSWVALGIFILLSVTDSVDGYLARSKNQVTNFGKFMDPLADKILVFAALIALVELSALPSWVVLIILMREFIVSGIRMLAASKGMVIAASWYGKAKTVAQIIAIILFILKEALASSGCQDIANPLYIVAWIVMIIALILTVVSMIDYIYNARFVFVSSKNNEDSTKDYATKLVGIAKNKKVKFCSAESLTGGLISSSIVSVPGASKVYVGGVASYAYSAKEALLGVDNAYLKSNGAVNDTVAKQMANGAKINLACDYSVSTTGIAGPDKDEFGTEVGTVYIGVATPKNTYAKQFKFDGNRSAIRNKAAQQAIKLLLDEISA